VGRRADGAGVEGWLDLTEAWELQEAVRRRSEAGTPPCAVEIGSWKGRSAIALACGLPPGPGGRVYAIDPHGQDVEGRPTDQPDTFDELLANLERAGVHDRVEVIRGYAHAARRTFDDGQVDVLFIDGSHEYEGVLQDIDDWTSSLADGAIVAFNDIGFPGVNAAVRERLLAEGSPFRRPWFTFNTLFVEHRPNAPWTGVDDRRRWRLRAFLVFIRRLNGVWGRTVAGAPGWVQQALGAVAWVATRVLLRKTPYPDDR
jgi:hypothetical protein